MSKSKEVSFSDFDPSMKLWLEDGLWVFTTQDLPRVSAFFDNLKSKLGAVNLINSGFPYTEYIDGVSDFYGFNRNLASIQGVLSSEEKLLVVELFETKEDIYWEILSGRANFLQEIANRNHFRSNKLYPITLRQAGQILTPMERCSIALERRIDGIHTSAERLSADITIDSVVENGLPFEGLRHFQYQVEGFHRIAAVLERDLTNEEIRHFCMDLGFTPEIAHDTVNDLEQAGNGDNPFPGLLGLMFNPGTSLLGLIEGKRVKIEPNPNYNAA